MNMNVATTRPELSGIWNPDLFSLPNIGAKGNRGFAPLDLGAIDGIGSAPKSKIAAFLQSDGIGDIDSDIGLDMFDQPSDLESDKTDNFGLMEMLLLAIVAIIQALFKGQSKDEDADTIGKDLGIDTRPISGPDKTNPTSNVGPTSMPKPTATVEVNETIVVKAGQVFDGGGKLYKAGASLGDGSQSENQKPVFILEPGATVKNLQYEGADGIHTMGNATIQNVWCRNVGEDGMTMKKPGNVTWSGGGAVGADDKLFQLNAGGSFTLENFMADGFGKAIRTNGGKNFDIDITVRNCHFKNGKEAIVRTDATGARIKLEGVTFKNVKNDVLAPAAASVVGAVKAASKVTG